MTRLLVRKIQPKLQNSILRVQKRGVHLEHSTVLNSQSFNTFACRSELWNCKKSKAHPNRRRFTSATFVTKFLLAITQTEGAQPKKINGEQKCGCNSVVGRDRRWEFEVRSGQLEAVFCGLRKGYWETLKDKFFHGHIGCTNYVQEMFEKLRSAAKLNGLFGFVLKNVVDWTCRYFYPHENNTWIERWKLLPTKGDLVEIENELSNTDVIEAFS